MNRWRGWTFGLLFIALVLAVVVGVQAVMLHTQGWRVQLGNVAEWVAALGTAVAIVAVLFAALGYRHDVRTRVEDEKQRAAVERRQQAELLSGWFVHYGSARQGPQMGNASPEIINVTQIGLINASQVVVYDLFAAALCRHQSHPTPMVVNFDEASAVVRRPGGAIQSVAVEMGFVPPVEWEARRDRLAVGSAKVLAPGRWSVELRLGTTSVVPSELHLFFRDHRGVYWWRDAVGHLTEMPAPVDDQNRKSRVRLIEEALGEEPTDARVGVLSPKPLPETAAT
ncbi:hypothetical protein BST14_25175 [Mycobacterium arosiense ATCC BAA-1401 = DSM 45069]|uniref:Uncharacterized protein n=1 Tax=Mycobacterium arosiense ATCC BAA-1401 = DSM 45069 TaxID=1265311 RepID=A0A1W9Z7H2_MYCAI|nr:hypothetical protein BST14_25175 [Mycobacterium arosiense ATCC BAA-1401 = DSM 45069]